MAIILKNVLEIGDVDDEKKFERESSRESEEDENVECFIRGNQFSNDTREEKWIRCSACFRRCYELRTSISQANKFLCDFYIDREICFISYFIRTYFERMRSD